MFLQVFLTCCAILHTYTYSILGPRLWSLKLEAFTNLHVLFRKRRSDTPGMQTQILRMEVNAFLKRLQWFQLKPQQIRPFFRCQTSMFVLRTWAHMPGTCMLTCRCRGGECWAWRRCWAGSCRSWWPVRPCTRGSSSRSSSSSPVRLPTLNSFSAHWRWNTTCLNVDCSQKCQKWINKYFLLLTFYSEYIFSANICLFALSHWQLQISLHQTTFANTFRKSLDRTLCWFEPKSEQLVTLYL